MAQMAAVRKIQAHKSLMWTHQCLIHLKVGWTATQALYIDSPFLRIKVERRQGTRLTQQLNRVNVLIPSVVTGTRVAFRVFVGHGRTKRVEHGTRGEILGRNQDNRFPLTLYFLFLFSGVKVLSSISTLSQETLP